MINLQRDSPSYWLGRLEEADAEIAFLVKCKGKRMRKRLTEAERLRCEAMREIKRLARS